MKIYKTKIEISKEKDISVTAVNNREKNGKVIKLTVGEGEKEKKAGYIIVLEAIKAIAKRL